MPSVVDAPPRANKKNVKKWVDALRSGKYPQGRGALTDQNGKFCCLGVACDVAKRNGVKVKLTHMESGVAQYDGFHGYLPPVVLEWLGMDSGGYHDDEIDIVLAADSVDGGIRATSANDSSNWSFNEIADALEKRYLTE